MSSVSPTKWWQAAPGGPTALLHGLRRAASFRMALLFLALYGLISLLLFAFLYVQISAYALGRIDDWLARERNGLMRDGIAELHARVDFHARLDPDNVRPFGLYDAQGRHLAGTFPGPLPPLARDGRAVSMAVQGGRRELRAAAFALENGQTLLLSQDLHEFKEFDEVLVRALASAAALALLLGMTGAAIIGRGSVRRLDAITRAIEAIVSGDLSQRLPQRPAQGANDDVDRLVIVVNGMLDNLERLMREVKGVCDGIAHDLRTPLARLLAGLERAQRRAGSAADYHEAVQAAIGETLSLLATFNAMLRISEVEDGIRRAGFTNVDLAAVLDDVIEFYEPSGEEKHLAIDYARPADLRLPLRGEASLLFEAFGNLLDNAIKFTPDGGRIAVRLWRDDAGYAIDIEDTGPGIPAAEREAVFRRFHRSEASRHLPGNGLGLSLVAAVARLHGFSIAIADSQAGCRIELRLPMSLNTPVPERMPAP